MGAFAHKQVMSVNRKIVLTVVVVVAVLAGVLALVLAFRPATADPTAGAQPATATSGTESAEASEASEALNAYSDWAADNPDLAVNAGGLRMQDEVLVVQWKGQAPEQLRQFLESKGTAVVWQEVPYSANDIAEAGRQLTEAGRVPDGAVLEPDADYSGLVVVLPAGVPSATVHFEPTVSGVPVRVVEGDQALSQAPGTSN